MAAPRLRIFAPCKISYNTITSHACQRDPEYMNICVGPTNL